MVSNEKVFSVDRFHYRIFFQERKREIKTMLKNNIFQSITEVETANRINVVLCMKYGFNTLVGLFIRKLAKNAVSQKCKPQSNSYLGSEFLMCCKKILFLLIR